MPAIVTSSVSAKKGDRKLDDHPRYKKKNWEGASLGPLGSCTHVAAPNDISFIESPEVSQICAYY